MKKDIEQNIAEWKAKHGRVYSIEVGEHVAYVRKPTRKDMSYANANAKGDGYKVNETLFENCYLGGDDIIKSDTAVFFAAITAFAIQIVAPYEAEVKEL